MGSLTITEPQYCWPDQQMDSSRLLDTSRLVSPVPMQASVSDATADAREISVSGKAKGLDRLCQFKCLEYLCISIVDSSAAGIVGQIPALRRLVIHDLRVNDLRAFSDLSHLDDLAIVGSSKLKSISGVENLRNLRSLILCDNCNYDSVADLATLSALETLWLEGGMSKLLRISTLAPLERLHRLERLRLASIRVADGSLRSLHGLASLREVFIAKAFSPAEFRGLAKALPHARGQFVDSYREEA